ncbi:sulfite exporter TauE/SafE family protein [Paenibacillus paeoniae]|uniref:Sulfite exporter TauE/SafE family protein n=1 Tax=Paenibacillus paeoniae TaxID=2292705 RepID=A0A371PLH6_9BACL|nr:sulfite exporter TauE/SafE family protein [Paenibacillus paeoniae]REK76617.1 sulfite exporter TauE/SafE family protein [Paenibacillus paeoniae]
MSLSLNGIGLIFLTGLFSAPHCIGMCGGIVSAVSLQSSESARRSMLLYNAGRILSYSLLGATMGAVGSFVDVAGRFAGIRGLASIIGGCFVLLWIWRKMQIPFLNRLSGRLHQELATGARAAERKETAHLLATGFSFGFLPCGLTYAMGINAAATGSFMQGALVMAVFGLATVPALAFAASIATLANKRWRRFMRRAGVVTAVAVGLISILRGLAANGIIPSVSPWLW